MAAATSFGVGRGTIMPSLNCPFVSSTGFKMTGLARRFSPRGPSCPACPNTSPRRRFGSTAELLRWVFSQVPAAPCRSARFFQGPPANGCQSIRRAGKVSHETSSDGKWPVCSTNRRLPNVRRERSTKGAEGREHSKYLTKAMKV